MKTLNKILSWVYALTICHIPIAVWSIWVGIVIAIRMDRGYLFPLFIGAVGGILLLLQQFVRIRWGIKPDWYDLSSIRINKNKILEGTIRGEISKTKDLKVSFGSPENLRQLWINILLAPDGVDIEPSRKSITRTTLDSNYPDNISNIPKSIFNVSYSEEGYRYTIRFDGKPPLQLVRIESSISVVILKSFSRLYRSLWKTYLQLIQTDFKDLEKSDRDVEEILADKNISGNRKIIYFEYGIKFGSYVEKISFADYIILKEKYEKACRIQETKRLKKHTENYL